MKIAVIGTGISGMVCARLLNQQHEVDVYEANHYVGGHTNTVQVNFADEELQIDTGFIVYNEKTYPNFTRMLSELNIETAPTSMSFSVQCARTRLEYNGTSLNGVFSQRLNLLRPSFHRLLRDILKFNREGLIDYSQVSADQTVAEYLSQNRYSEQFAEKYLFPMGAAIWSCPFETFSQFPIRFILEFYVNHGLLSLKDRPVWRVISGGSKNYIEPLIRPFKNQIRLNSPIEWVRRAEESITLKCNGQELKYDEVVFACHSDQALKLLVDADNLEKTVLSAFPYSMNIATLHTDKSILPKRKRTWASWNYHIPKEKAQRPTLTYNMNILQRIKSSRTYCVTLNDEARINPSSVLKQFVYAHPIFTTNRDQMQKRHDELIRHRRTSYCGAYWRNGFHEDGVVSALAVVQKFGIVDWSFDSNSVTGTGKPEQLITSASAVEGTTIND